MGDDIDIMSNMTACERYFTDFILGFSNRKASPETYLYYKARSKCIKHVDITSLAESLGGTKADAEVLIGAVSQKLYEEYHSFLDSSDTSFPQILFESIGQKVSWDTLAEMILAKWIYYSHCFTIYRHAIENRDATVESMLALKEKRDAEDSDISPRENVLLDTLLDSLGKTAYAAVCYKEKQFIT